MANALTGIVSCFFDSVPALFLCGQAQSYLLKGDRPVRPYGIRECDAPVMAGR